jgi:hypothetical protein
MRTMVIGRYGPPEVMRSSRISALHYPRGVVREGAQPFSASLNFPVVAARLS